MATRKRNMLEAFQASKQVSGDGGAREVGEGAPAAGPFAQKPAVAPARTSIEEIEAEIKRRETKGGWTITLQRSAIGPLVLSQLILLVLVYWVGRLSVQPVEAEEGSGGAAAPFEGPVGHLAPPPAKPAAESGSATTSPGPEAGGSGTAQDPATTAFYDPQNLFTLCAIQYPNTKHGEQLAWGVHAYLQTQGLPVVTPVRKRSYILVCVGAAQRQEDLLPVQERLRSLRGPDPDNDSRPFHSAFVVNISDQVKR